MDTNYETYRAWTDKLESEEDQHYYINLLRYSSHILADLREYKQFVVAKKLNLPTPKLSTLKPVLEAYVSIKG